MVAHSPWVPYELREMPQDHEQEAAWKWEDGGIGLRKDHSFWHVMLFLPSC